MHISTSQLVSATVVRSTYMEPDTALVITIMLKPTDEGKEVIELLAQWPRIPDDGPSFFITRASIEVPGQEICESQATNTPTPPQPVLHAPAVFKLAFPYPPCAESTDGALIKLEISSDFDRSLPDFVGFRYKDGGWTEADVMY